MPVLLTKQVSWGSIVALGCKLSDHCGWSEEESIARKGEFTDRDRERASFTEEIGRAHV